MKRLSDRPGSDVFGGSEQQFEVIRRYSIAFLEKYVAGKDDLSGILEHQDPLVTRIISETSSGVPGKN